MKQIYSIIIIFLILGIGLVIGQEDQERMDNVINGQSGGSEDIQNYLSNNAEAFNHRIVQYPGSLNNNKVLREEWLKNYNIIDNGGDLKLTYQKYVNMYGTELDTGEFIVEVDGKEKTLFELGEIKVKKINEDGSIELEDGIIFSGGKISFSGVVDNDGKRLIDVNEGIFDVTNRNKDIEGYYKIVDSKVKFNDQIFSPYKWNVEFLGDQAGVFMPPLEDATFEMKLGKEFIEFNGIIDDETDNYRIDGIMRLNNDGNKIYKGVFKDSAGKVMLESKNEFFQYLKNGEQPFSDSLSYVQNNNGDLKVKAVGLEEIEDYLHINNAGGIKSISFEKINDGSEVYYYKEGSVSLRISKDGFSTYGPITEIEDMFKIINPKTGELESVNKIVGEIFTPESLQKVKEIRIAKEVVDTVKDMKKPIGIFISQENYVDENLLDLPSSHESAKSMADFLVENKGLSRDNVHYLQDKTYQETLDEIRSIKSNNPDSEFFVYYSGHGIREENNYYITSADSAFDEDGNNLRVLSPSDFNSIIGDKKPVYVIDSCHSGGFCGNLEGRYRLSATANDQEGTQIDTEDYKISLFTETLTNPNLPYNLDWPEISLTDNLIINGINDRWLTEVYSIKSYNRLQTPQVFKIILSIRDIIKIKL